MILTAMLGSSFRKSRQGFILLIAFSGILLLTHSCKSLSIPEGEKPLIELKTTECYGTCPVFTISIYQNRVATLEAIKFLDMEGSFITRLSNDTFSDLVNAFESASFFDFEDHYTGPVSDLPTKYISYREGGRSKTITDYYGAPQELKDLEKKIEQLVEQSSWKKR